MSVDILGTSWDQCWSMVQYSFTSTETKGSLGVGRTAQDGHLDSHTAPELSDAAVMMKWCLWTWQAQRTSFNTLGNWGHKTPTQSKKRSDKKERVKGSWLGTHTIHSVTCVYFIVQIPPFVDTDWTYSAVHTREECEPCCDDNDFASRSSAERRGSHQWQWAITCSIGVQSFCVQ